MHTAPADKATGKARSWQQNTSEREEYYQQAFKLYQKSCGMQATPIAG